MKNEKGFTLIEMMIVLLVISVLLIITVPNITQHNSNINTKGCDAFVKMVEGQVQAFRIDKKKFPDNIDELVTAGYIGGTICPDGKEISLSSDGKVTVPKDE
ncbi:competence type IV pilus major pilin ComGC [Bacillus sp. B15-48]|uniref:competence type IV pilus major pilin ComGC n=1 Tax=Bacillus sp. B15-48 TaxID=1548601 RepID=UPI00193EDA73|nr:competence type IV pilus major pilin ComGC [Bacillus sp. B15-48]MBM4762277.1 prepilin-type N-terminal cleavage/methylation domain-containing protein [Bacillus sp. B15-48]